MRSPLHCSSSRAPAGFYPRTPAALEHESKLDVLKANLGTHVIFRLASEKGHKLAAGVIGEHEVIEVGHSVTRGVTTVNRSRKVKPVLGTWVFRKLVDFHAIATAAGICKPCERVGPATLRSVRTHSRSIATHLRDPTPAEIQEAARTAGT